MEMNITNARKIDCYQFFPETALSAQIRISKIAPANSAVFIYTPRTGDKPIRFDGPETTATVPVQGHEMWAQPILGNESYYLECLGYRDDLTR
jgi:hypothetical protein